ncbi:unnamed protein product [Moneuplotes crassus]|uniref:Large ribosomal subunit protein uL15/eL18 domain-containing protein n=2 Tax=Euplotes crassus TaxID=5936 RepID=A0AAD2D6L4_EUPCR|nr:unnamed protein product [Moneuplotes crassus]
MGIDLIAGGRTPSRNKKNTKSTNLYLHLLIRLYRFLDRRTESNFNRVVLRRLVQSRITKAPMSISRVATHMKGKEDKIAVLVGTVTNDNRFLDVPALKICALRFTETARARITNAGGQCITFDELALLAPTGSNTILLRGPKRREAQKYFGKGAGISGSGTHIKKQSKKSSEAKRK